jgi:purine-binding chemotaxis protein CheW
MTTSKTLDYMSGDALNVAYKGYKDGSVDFFGDQIQVMTGYTKDVFNSKKKKWTDIVLEEDKSAMEETFRKALKADKTYKREYRIRKKDANVVWMQEWAQIVCDDQVNIEYVIGILVDITDQKLDEEKRLKIKKLTGGYLIFNLDNTAYGIEISKIKETMGMMPITTVPDMPDFVKGIINLRGKPIPVIDLRLRFKLEPIDYTDLTSIVIVEIQDDIEAVQVGIIVDAVSEVLNIDGENIEDNPKFGADLNSDYILGLAKLDDGIKILLKTDKVLSSEEQKLIENIT